MYKQCFLLLLVNLGLLYQGNAFPQEQIKTAATQEGMKNGLINVTEFEVEEAPLHDMMDRYAEVPLVTGDMTCQCGMPTKRIVDGDDAEISQYPWTALLYAVESDTLRIPYCGGALINNQYILTASHCVDGMNPKHVEVVLREQNLSTVAPPEMMRAELRAIRIEVDRFIQHPAYSRRTLDNDIALVKLKIRVPLDVFSVAPICLPREGASFSQGLRATIAGYGAISESGKPASKLQMAEVRILSNELCNTMEYHNGKLSANMICADGNGKGPCAGDTGGGLMIRSSRDSERQVLAGIASWSTTCNDPTRPAVYTRVQKYEPWILENTRDAEYCKN